MKKIKRFIKRVIALPSNIINRIVFLFQNVKTGKNFRTSGIIKVFNHNICEFGDNCIVNSSINSNYTSGVKSVIFIGKNAKLIFGNNVGISNVRIVCANHIRIEDDVMLGANCKIYDTNFHSLDYEDRINKNDCNIITKPIIIKKGAFIGADSIILKGVTIGEHAIIGAGAVVTKDVGDNEVWAGNPAKKIR